MFATKFGRCRFEEANFIRLPKKRKGQGTRQRGGASDVLDDLDLGAFPSGSAHQPGSGGKKKSSARKRSAGGKVHLSLPPSL